MKAEWLILFGVGWGLAGYCPGPAITSLGSGQVRPFLFVVGMLGGMYVFKVLNARLKFERSDSIC